MRAVLNWNTDVFSNHKADIGCCNFVKHEIELDEGAVPHRDNFKIDYRAAARDALNRVQQEVVTKEIKQKVKLELENEKI